MVSLIVIPRFIHMCNIDPIYSNANLTTSEQASTSSLHEQHFQHIMADAHTSPHVSAKELGFSFSQGVDWSKYIAYRPIYPESFFKRIYEYHSKKDGAAWSVAHDIGTGCGVVSFTLASRFENVVASDPNDGYITLARKLLVEEASLPESKFKLLQEPAEKSSVQSGTVDLAAVCECIQWTNPDLALKEFAREVKPGGTLLLTYYTRPLIEGSEEARKSYQAV
jgi:SAM-dependent methyltransferase